MKDGVEMVIDYVYFCHVHTKSQTKSMKTHVCLSSSFFFFFYTELKRRSLLGESVFNVVLAPVCLCTPHAEAVVLRTGGSTFVCFHLPPPELPLSASCGSNFLCPEAFPLSGTKTAATDLFQH